MNHETKVGDVFVVKQRKHPKETLPEINYHRIFQITGTNQFGDFTCGPCHRRPEGYGRDEYLDSGQFSWNGKEPLFYWENIKFVGNRPLPKFPARMWSPTPGDPAYDLMC